MRMPIKALAKILKMHGRKLVQSSAILSPPSVIEECCEYVIVNKNLYAFYESRIVIGDEL